MAAGGTWWQNPLIKKPAEVERVLRAARAWAVGGGKSGCTSADIRELMDAVEALNDGGREWRVGIARGDLEASQQNLGFVVVRRGAGVPDGRAIAWCPSHDDAQHVSAAITLYQKPSSVPAVDALVGGAKMTRYATKGDCVLGPDGLVFADACGPGSDERERRAKHVADALNAYKSQG